MTKPRCLRFFVVLALASSWAAAAPAQGNLRVGAARVDITPPADPANQP
jgi:hypothetical protein